MAIGLGRMFGFRFMENFNYPYLSRSVTELLVAHFSVYLVSEYVYIPLGGNRKGRYRTYLNLFLVFLPDRFVAWRVLKFCVLGNLLWDFDRAGANDRKKNWLAGNYVSGGNWLADVSGYQYERDSDSAEKYVYPLRRSLSGFALCDQKDGSAGFGRHFAVRTFTGFSFPS